MTAALDLSEQRWIWNCGWKRIWIKPDLNRWTGFHAHGSERQMSRPSWLPAGLGKGFQELVEETRPPLTQDTFEDQFRKFLRCNKLNRLDKIASKEVTQKLFEWAVSFLKQGGAIQQLRPIVKSAKRKKQMRALLAITNKPPLSEALNDLEEVVEQFERGRFAFLQLTIKPVRNQIEPLRQAIVKAEEQFGLIHRLWRNDEQQATDSKPEPESQFMQQIDTRLRRTVTGLSVTDRHWIIGACVKAAGLLPEIPEWNLLDVVNSRLDRAKRSSRKAAANWGE